MFSLSRFLSRSEKRCKKEGVGMLAKVPEHLRRQTTFFEFEKPYVLGSSLCGGRPSLAYEITFPPREGGRERRGRNRRE